MGIASELRRLLGNDAVADDPQTLADHSGDKWFAHETPKSSSSPARAMRLKNCFGLLTRIKYPVTARGAGYGYVGSCVPVRRGIALSLVRMNRIKEVSFADAIAIVEPGVITGELKRAAREQKLFYPPDPASFEHCTIGGNVATNAGGPRCLKYGVTRNYITGLEVVLANGEVLRTGGRVHKNKTGFDLIGLFVGSEGMLGIVTEITVKLLPLPPARATLSASFNSMSEAAAMVQQIFAAGFLPSSLEIADKFTLEAARQDSGAAHVPSGNAHLLVDLDGQDQTVGAEMQKMRDLIQSRKPTALEIATNETDCEKLLGAPSPIQQFTARDWADEIERRHRCSAQPSGRSNCICRGTLRALWISDRLFRSRRRRQHSRQPHGGSLQSRSCRTRESARSAR